MFYHDFNQMKASVIENVIILIMCPKTLQAEDLFRVKLVLIPLVVSA